MFDRMFRYATPQQAIAVARQALWLTIWLSQYEFTRIEKDQRLSILSWPNWYIGVSRTCLFRFIFFSRLRSFQCTQVIYQFIILLHEVKSI